MSAAKQQSPLETYINELPYSVTRAIISSLDSDKAWEALACEAGYTFDKIKLFELEYQRYNGSPTKALLWDWGSRNTTTKQLYFKLKKIERLRELQILENYITSVCPRQKDIINDSDDNVPSIPQLNSLPPSGLPKPSERQPAKVKSEKVEKFESEVNFNQPNSQVVGTKKQFVKILSSMDKDKHYDDKVIPGQEHSSPSLTSYTQNKAQENSDSLISSSSSRLYQVASSLSSDSSDTNRYSSKQTSDKDSSLQSLFSSDSGSINLAMASLTPQFTYTELATSTNQFNESNLIGEGAFGKVFYSILRGTKCAIKTLEKQSKPSASQDEKCHQLSCELSSLLRYRHENIVTLYGYAVDGPALCLVYQFMVNGSLEDCLHSNGTVLNWEQRIRILCGSITGLRYLHNMGDVPLIHGDIKSANILLDRYYEAKLGDLGQAQHANRGSLTGKLTHITKQDMNSKLYGTKAYLPPELLRGNENMSTKTDIYAFGVVMLETVSGLYACDESRASNKFLVDYFVDVIEDCDCDKWVEMFCDKSAGKPPLDILLDILKLAVSCVSQSKKKRPLTDKVADDLENEEKKWNEVYASFPEYSRSLTSHMSHTSEVSMDNMAVNVGLNMAANVGPTTTTKSNTTGHVIRSEESSSPINFFQEGHQSLPEPFKLQLIYDKYKQEGKELAPMLENLKSEIESDRFKEHESDPKKMAEIEKGDKRLKITSNKTDPQKLAQLNLFDNGQTCQDSPPAESIPADENKLKAILKFDKDNMNPEIVMVKNDDKCINDSNDSSDKTDGTDAAPVSLKDKRAQIFKLYETCADEDDSNEEEEDEEPKEEN